MNPFTSQRLKYVADVRFSNVDKLSEPDEIPVRLCNYTDVYKNERITHDMPFMEATASAAEIRRFGLHVDDVIFTKDSESPTDIAVPAVVASTAPDLVCGYHLAIARPHTARLSGRFLLRALQATGVREQFYMQANGVTRFGLSQAAIGNVRVPVPPLNEQARIADFLDRKTAAIDALIAKQEQLLALLAEKRQALITQAVTKGLDPNVPMKDSGVEWIGEIPRHWQIRRLKHLGQIRSGIAKGRDPGDKATSPRPYLRVANVQNGWLDLDDIDTIEVTEEEAHRYALQVGDVLMNEGGDFDKLGRGCVWEGQIADCIHQNHVFAFRPAKGINSRWINLATQAGYLRHFFILRSKQSTNLASISATNLGEAPIVMPPPGEVEFVLTHVREELHRLETLSQRVQAMVEKLREYRQTLITAAVTGQLDVTATEAEQATNVVEAATA